MTETTKIKNRFAELDITIDADEIARRLEDLTKRFKVPIVEAERSVVSYFLRKHNIAADEYYTGPHEDGEMVKVKDIDAPEKWINLRAKVTKLWDNATESIDQVGLIADETGQIKFVKWAASELPQLEEGKSYEFKNLTTDEFGERLSVKFNKTSTIEELTKDIETSTQSGSSEVVAIDSIADPDKWVSLEAKVIQLWESEQESIDQVGLLGDETGTIRFVKWVVSKLPQLEEGKSYALGNMTTDAYNERFSIKMNKTTTIKELDHDIEAVETSEVTEFAGALVHIQDGSGLIKRCPICNKALMKGSCMEHGNVDGTHDLRIKAVLDNGTMVQEALFNREITESISGITLDEANEMAMEALDQIVVVDEMKKRLVGRYYTASGSVLDRYMLVEDIQVAGNEQEEAA